MKFKHEKLREELAGRDAILLAIVADFEALSLEFGIEPTVTRVLEPIQGSSGVHEAGRAVDFRDEYAPGKFLYTREQRKQIVDKINARYPRRDKRPSIVWHEFNGGPMHAHVQSAASASMYLKPKGA